MPLAKDSQTSSEISPGRCSSRALWSLSLNSSWLICVREMPTTANSSGSLLWEARSYRAGTSLRAVRSPEAPKITMTPGSGTRGSLCSSRSMSCRTCVSAIVWLLLLLCGRLFDRVPAELAAQGGYDLHGEGVLLAGGETGEEGACYGIRRHVLCDRLEDGPASLAGVLDVAADAVQVGVVFEGVLGELEEPATDDAPLVPQAREGPEVVVVAGLLQDLEPFGVGLEHPVLDAVVDHLGEVPGSRVPEERVPLPGREGLEGRLDVLEGVRVAPDHRAVADVVAPDASRDSGIEPPQTRVPDLPGPRHRIPEVGVGPVHDDVALVRQVHELVDHLVRHVPGGQHGPKHPRRLLHLHELLDAVSAKRSVLDGIVHLAGRTVARDDAVVTLVDEPAHHVEAHPAHAVDPDIHVLPPSGRRLSAFQLVSFFVPVCLLCTVASRLFLIDCLSRGL